ncbi:MAG: hypothetical protein IJ043_00130 [Clostridia bacterium]|nr:hypothetical protein [Clostridia bacterium]
MSYYLDMDDHSTFRVMNPAGVRQYTVPSPTLHNACWDAAMSGEGKVYLALCSELTTNEYAKLAEYDPEQNTLKELHYTKEFIFPGRRFIRDSKFHTSMSWMNDGRLVMLTHTTDKSPEHPAWLPQGYFNHPFEGYPGSSLLTYDPKTGKMENWGIPVHRETIYGAAYDKHHNILYGIGYFKGHLYGIDLTDRSVRDYGEVTERASYRLVVGPDDNIYFTTRNGLLQRINVREKQVENLRIQLPHEKVEGRFRPYLSAAANGSDGKLYLVGMHDKRLSRFDPATGELEVLGDYMPVEQFCKGVEANIYMGSMGFDQKDVLYYVVSAVKKGGGEEFLLPSMLMRWDLFGGKQPEILGLLGTKERTTYQCCMMIMDRQRDRMLCFGTNHADDGPNFITVDLAEYRDQAGTPGEQTTDPLVYRGNGQYDEYAARMHRGAAIMRQNSSAFHPGREIPVPIWMEYGDEDVENSAVAALRWEGDRLIAVCGKEHFTQYTIDTAGRILSAGPCQAPAPAEKPQIKGDLPYYPGRQYKRGAAKAVALSGGRRFIATEDGLLAIEKDGNFFALGPGWVHGPVRDLTVSPDGTKVYGVAGDEDDLGMVFSYDDTCGLRWLGHVMTGHFEYGYHGSDLLSAIALSENGELLAIGGGGRMGMVYLYIKE